MPQKSASGAVKQVGGRKVAFSGKKKKDQLKMKRQKKAGIQMGPAGDDASEGERELGDRVLRVNDMGNPTGRNTRYALIFQQQTKEEMDEIKKRVRRPFKFLGEEALYLVRDTDPLGMPRRPVWEHGWSKEKLDAHENKYFREFTRKLMQTQPSLSYFELNLETWRQLWRVIEMSDVLLLIADVRYPLIHIPLSLLEYIGDLGKRVIIVLNKVDLVDPELAASWITFLEKEHSGVKVIPFASYAGCKAVGKHGRGKMRTPLHSCLALLDAVKSVLGSEAAKIDLSSWENKIREDCELHGSQVDHDSELEVGEVIEQDDVVLSSRFQEGLFLTLGMLGHPNVGKSSLLNALMGKKVVSVSRTPGHTKHFQTIFLTKQLRLCDCPGLVFPTKHPRELQVVSGSFPIAQLRTPLAAVEYVAQRIHVERILRLPKVDTDESGWSAFEIAESWAEKRGFITARTGRPDVNRAAHHLLRMVLDGRTLCVAFRPPKEEHDQQPDKKLINKILEIRGVKREALSDVDENDESDVDSVDSEGGDGTADEESGDNTGDNISCKKGEASGAEKKIMNRFAALVADDDDDDNDE
ncbi:guanine nucleotide-binding protein-like 1 [Varroa jacobsoni]|uniref:guanine nucleotide-binding protein-like 1 n=1 Tax=Varroa jacobsoni TaxID=62625 RepID=UPI000BF691A2|nr:guanine nucleotide-binding protein-like 1 [Varroa jacobsoni]XP_022710460.1 guanine nucleotide-binding protein-like 1 [Varroa jacobsoni]XP_022710461.1 guanine nucleotide-binding protein-like 1 [Varroa jacobsoni]